MNVYIHNAHSESTVAHPVSVVCPRSSHVSWLIKKYTGMVAQASHTNSECLNKMVESDLSNVKFLRKQDTQK